MKTLAVLIFAASAFAQTGALAPVPRQQPLGNAGQVMAGRCMYSYLAGTTTPRNTFSDSTLSTPNTNPIVLDSSGRLPAVYLSPVSYKFVFADRVNGACPGTPGTVIWSQDNVYDSGQLAKIAAAAALAAQVAAYAAPGGAALIGFQPTGGSTPTTVAAALNVTILDTGFSGFSTACAAAVSASKTLIVSKSWTSLSTLTCAANLQFVTGGKLTPSASQTITLSGSITAPPTAQIFDIGAASSVVTISSYTPLIFPGWWGAVGDDSSSTVTVNTAALNAAVAVAKTSHSKVQLTPGTYRYTAPLVLDASLSFCGTPNYGGNGTNATVLKRANDAVGVKVISLQVEVCDLKITGVAPGTTDGIVVGDATHDATGSNIHGVFVSTLGGHCFNIGFANASRFDDLEALSCTGDGYRVVSLFGINVNGNHFGFLKVTGCAGDGMRFDLASTNHVQTLVTQGNGRGISIAYPHNKVDFVYSEGNVTASLVIVAPSGFDNEVHGTFLDHPVTEGVALNEIHDNQIPAINFNSQLRVETSGPVLFPTAFGDLPSAAVAREGTIRLLYNGTAGSPCTAGAKIVLAVQIGGAWSCSGAFN